MPITNLVRALSVAVVALAAILAPPSASAYQFKASASRISEKSAMAVARKVLRKQTGHQHWTIRLRRPTLRQVSKAAKAQGRAPRPGTTSFYATPRNGAPASLADFWVTVDRAKGPGAPKGDQRAQARPIKVLGR